MTTFLPTDSSQEPEREWDALKAAQIAEEVKSINIVALKSSNIEYLIPKAFRVLFILIVVAVPLEAWRNYDAISVSTNSSVATSPTATQSKL